MLDVLRVRPHIVRRLQAGPVGDVVDAFADHLQAQGYPRDTIRRRVRALDQFNQWLVREQLALPAVTAAVVARFVRTRRRRTSSTRPSGRPCEIATGVRVFAAFLWTRGLAPREPKGPDGEHEPWLQRFEAHLTNVCALAVGTRRIYLRYARLFVAAHGVHAITAEAVVRFVQAHVARLTPAARRAPITAVRVWLRFLVRSGVLRAGLDAAVPGIREWKHAGIPRVLTSEDIARVLTMGRPTGATATRDAAMLLLLARLGLRASDIAALRLAAIDWHGGVLHLAPGKTHRARVLPLSRELGEALVAVLRARPRQLAHDAVFVNARPPYRPVSSATVSAIARQALHRAGLTVPRSGAHVFRHTVATQLVRRGVPMKAVADVLGHARLITTTVYAKLDVDTLAPVALPWPGAMS